MAGVWKQQGSTEPWVAKQNNWVVHMVVIHEMIPGVLKLRFSATTVLIPTLL